MVEDITPRELLGFRLIGYSIGDFGISLVNILIGTFIFQFYVYTINLNSILTSIGISLHLFIGALFSVIFGVVVDNKPPGKFGKRRPFLLIGLPVWVLANILIWFPPWYAPQSNSFYWPTAIYFWSMIILKAISGTLIFNVYLSMLPEQSQTEKNRKAVASIRAVFAIIASILALLLPLIVQSILEDPENVKWWQPSGKLILSYIPIIGITFACFGLITIIFTFFSVSEKFHNNSPIIEKNKVSIVTAFHQIIVPIKDKKFRKFLSVRFFNSISGKTLGILVIPFLAFVLKFRENEFFIYILVSIFSKFTWYLIWRKIFAQKSLVSKFSILLGFASIASLLDIIFLFQDLDFVFRVVMFIIAVGTVLGAMYTFPLFSIPIGAALVHEAAYSIEESNSTNAVSRLSGAYYGSLSFMASMGQAFASIMLGVILTGPNESNPIIITCCISSMGIFYLISLFFVKCIKLN
ncbi:MAG: MFS transporter [Candidatus Hodarchaeota archaeon]